MQVVSIISTKGGVGKTTTAANLGGLPVHRVEFRQPAGRVAPTALQTMRALASELFPQWRERFALVTGRPDAQATAGSASHGERL